jgi:hypothetical protein
MLNHSSQQCARLGTFGQGEGVVHTYVGQFCSAGRGSLRCKRCSLRATDGASNRQYLLGVDFAAYHEQKYSTTAACSVLDRPSSDIQYCPHLPVIRKISAQVYVQGYNARKTRNRCSPLIRHAEEERPKARGSAQAFYRQTRRRPSSMTPHRQQTIVIWNWPTLR